MLVSFPELISDHFTDGETEGPAGLNNLPKVLQLPGAELSLACWSPGLLFLATPPPILSLALEV